MNRPEKKNLIKTEHPNFKYNFEYDRAYGYDQACDDWEAWLLKDIIKYLETYEPTEFKTIGLSNEPYVSESWHIKDHLKRIAKAIAERIGK